MALAVAAELDRRVAKGEYIAPAPEQVPVEAQRGGVARALDGLPAQAARAEGVLGLRVGRVDAEKAHIRGRRAPIGDEQPLQAAVA